MTQHLGRRGVEFSIGTLSPAERGQSPGEIARRIQLLIAERKMTVGERLVTERELATMLDSRLSAVEGGIAMLTAMGILEVRPGAGTFVGAPQHQVLADPAVLDLSELRALEQATVARKIADCAVAELAATTAARRDLDDLRRYLARSDEEESRMRVAYTLDLTFEERLGAITVNEYLLAVQREAHRHFRAAWERIGYMPGPKVGTYADHWSVFHAVAQRRAAAARERMSSHIDRVLVLFDCD